MKKEERERRKARNDHFPNEIIFTINPLSNARKIYTKFYVKYHTNIMCVVCACCPIDFNEMWFLAVSTGLINQVFVTHIHTRINLFGYFAFYEQKITAQSNS